MTKVLKQRLLVRVLCLLLSLFLLVMPIVTVHAQAAFAETLVAAYAQEIIAGVLVSSGLTFLNETNLLEASSLVYLAMRNSSSVFVSTLMNLASAALLLGDDIVSKGLRVSVDLWNAICDAVTDLGFNPSVTDTPSLGSWKSFTGECAEDFLEWTESIDWRAIALSSTPIHTFKINGDTYSMQPDGITPGTWNFYKNGVKYTSSRFGDPIVGASVYFFVYQSLGRSELTVGIYTLRAGATISGVGSYRLVHVGIGVSFSPELEDLYSYPVTLEIPDGYIPVSGTLTYPGDQTLVLAPPLPTTTADPDTGKEVVVFPPLSVYPDDWTADFPRTDTGEQVDVPTDTLVDVGTGEKVDTDVNNPDVPDVKPDVPNWPSTGDLSIPALIASKFPFSLPFDVARLIGVLQADPVAPVFRFPLKYGTIMNDEIVLDLSRWSNVVEVIRWGELIAFVAGLVYATRNYIKW